MGSKAIKGSAHHSSIRHLPVIDHAVRCATSRRTDVLHHLDAITGLVTELRLSNATSPVFELDISAISVAALRSSRLLPDEPLESNCRLALALSLAPLLLEKETLVVVVELRVGAYASGLDGLLLICLADRLATRLELSLGAGGVSLRRTLDAQRGADKAVMEAIALDVRVNLVTAVADLPLPELVGVLAAELATLEVRRRDDVVQFQELSHGGIVAGR